MQVKSIAECSKGSILQYFQRSLSYHLSLRSLFSLFLSGCFIQVLLYFGHEDCFYLHCWPKNPFRGVSVYNGLKCAVVLGVIFCCFSLQISLVLSQVHMVSF